VGPDEWQPASASGQGVWLGRQAAGVGGVASASLPRAGAVSGHVTPPPSGAASAFRARAVSSGRSVLPGPPDLSDVPLDWEHLLGAEPTEDAATLVEFRPPGGLDAEELVDALLDRFQGRRPSTIASLLEGQPPDPVADYWLTVAALLQRRLASRLLNLIQDGLAADRTGRTAYQTALDTLRRWSRRPLNLD